MKQLVANELYEQWEKELDELRTPKDNYGRKFLGASIGPYIMGQPENGYGGKVLYRIRELRRLLSNETLTRWITTQQQVLQKDL